METPFIYDTSKSGRSTATTRTKAYKKAYNDWSYDMVQNHHCTVGIRHIMNKLHVTHFWITEHLMDNVEWCRITPTRLLELGMDTTSPLLFNELELRRYLQESAEFSRQTIVIDLAKIAPQKALHKADSDAQIQAFDNNCKDYGKRADAFLDLLEEDYENVNEYKRSKYPAKKVESFDFWSQPLRFSSDYPNRERAYRDFFRRGYVKINLFGKAIFVLLEDLDKVIYPLTIPYKA